MFLRKAIATIITSVVASILCVLWLILFDGESFTGSFGAFLFYSLYTIPIVFIYGCPVSYLSDLLTKRLAERRRKKLALLIHVFFGFCFTFIFFLALEPEVFLSGQLFNHFTSFFFWGATLASLVFWAIDEYIRCKKEGRLKLNRSLTG